MASKARNWTFLVYPESAPDDWLDILQSHYVPFVVSPLHDKDVAQDGTYKKSHFHVLWCFEGPRTYECMATITRSIGQPRPEPVLSLLGAYQYLSHANAPDKAQYNPDEIQHINGFVLRKKDQKDMAALRTQILTYVHQHRVVEFAQLVTYAVDNQLFDWLDELVKHTYFYTSHIKSARYLSVSQTEAVLASQWASTADWNRTVINNDMSGVQPMPGFEEDV